MLFALAGLLLLATPAAAAIKLRSVGTFHPGGPGAGAGQFSFSELPSSPLAVDQSSGDVYVGDSANNRVEKFDAEGNFILAFGKEVDKTKVEEKEAGEPVTEAEEDICAATSGDICQAGTVDAGTGEGAFNNPSALAVDPTDGDVYVSDREAQLIERFDSEGNFLSQFAAPTDAALRGGNALAVDSSGDVYLADGNGECHCVLKFTSSGNPDPTNPQIGSGVLESAFALAIDTSDNLYVADAGTGFVAKFAPDASLIAAAFAPGSAGVAVDPSTGDVWVDDDENETIGEYQSSGTQIASVTSPVDLLHSRGIGFSSTAQRLYLTDPDYSQVDIFQPLALPEATTGTSSDLTATSATFSGTVNPAGVELQECEFEYVDAAEYQPAAPNPYSAGNTAPCLPSTQEIGNATEAVKVTADIEGLTPGTTYHFRLQVANPDGNAMGSDQTFLTKGPTIGAKSASNITDTATTLNAQVNPHGVATTYQFQYGTNTNYGHSVPASPAAIGSGNSEVSVAERIVGLTPETTYHYRLIATNTDATSAGSDQTFMTYPPASAGPPDNRAYEQVTPIDKDGGNPTGFINYLQASPSGERITFLSLSGVPGGTGAQEFPLFLASRGSAGWTTQGQLPPANSGRDANVLGWSGDLSAAFDVATPDGGTPHLYLRDNITGALQTITTGEGSFSIDGTSADGSHVLFEDKGGQLLPGAAPSQDNLYLWDRDTGALSLVGVLPEAQCKALSLPARCAPPAGSFAGPYNWRSEDTSSGGGERAYYTENAISGDGSHVFFTAGGTGQIYVRENGTSTVQVSASQKTNGTGPGGTDPQGPQPAAWMASTPDGSHVFFTSHEELTNDANTGSADQGSDLYRFDVATGQLTDLTADRSDSNGAAVQGVLGTSSDGSYVYFVANGVLAAHASPGDCQGIEISGTCSLYLWHNGQISFIANLSANSGIAGGLQDSDARDWLPSSVAEGDPYDKTSRVTPDGQTVLFRSQQQLTGYDNAGFAEYYRYGAASGGLGCVSCNPTGALPTGSATLRSIDTTVATPGAVTSYLTRNLSADGTRVFFETPDALVPSDTNGDAGCHSLQTGGTSCQDVYEWEASGTGSCAESGPAFSRQDEGCLYLLSTGKSSDPSYFADASESGNDVFFFTTSPLVGQDTDQIQDIYDARIGGGIAAQSAPPPPCPGEACLPSAFLPPAAQTPPSSSFSGPGNPTPNHHQKRKHHDKHSKAHRRSRNAYHHRRGSR